MASTQDFRDYADRCLEWAASAESDQERKTLRRMALAWWRIAGLTEEGSLVGELGRYIPKVSERGINRDQSLVARHATEI